jgi:2-amino-4-hydroxy-6-hydroxymethyldihydropteridine diphosphokinase
VSEARRAILSLGSNLGDRARTLRDAVADIDALDGVRIERVSGLVETDAVKPDGVDVDAPKYLNLVVAAETTLAPLDLLAALGRIEAAHGRVREIRWGDRTLDIDIVALGALELSTDALTLPHPRAAERPFVIAPWLEIDPSATLPGIGRIDGLPAAAANVARYPAEADS